MKSFTFKEEHFYEKELFICINLPGPSFPPLILQYILPEPVTSI